MPAGREPQRSSTQKLPKRIVRGFGHAAEFAGSRRNDSSRIRRVLNRAAQIAGWLGTVKLREPFADNFSQTAGAIRDRNRVVFGKSAADGAGFSFRQGYSGSSAADCAGERTLMHRSTEALSCGNGGDETDAGLHAPYFSTVSPFRKILRSGNEKAHAGSRCCSCGPAAQRSVIGRSARRRWIPRLSDVRLLTLWRFRRRSLRYSDWLRHAAAGRLGNRTVQLHENRLRLLHRDPPGQLCEECVRNVLP